MLMCKGEMGMLKSIEVKDGQAVIDTTKNCIIIVEDGKVEALATPLFGTIEMPIQHRKIGKISITNTIKRV